MAKARWLGWVVEDEEWEDGEDAAVEEDGEVVDGEVSEAEEAVASEEEDSVVAEGMVVALEEEEVMVADDMVVEGVMEDEVAEVATKSCFKLGSDF